MNNKPEKTDTLDNADVASNEATTSMQFIMQRADQIEKKDTEWLWYPFFPQGTLCSLVGAQSAGKTYLILKLAAAIANGEALPGEDLAYNYSPFKEPRNVLLFMSEDDPNRTLKKRLDELVPEDKQRNIYIIGVGMGHIAMNDSAVEQAIADLKPALVVFDPVQAYMPLGIDMNNQVNVRAVLSSMIALAEKYNVTILYTQHMNKQITQSALYRANGSNELTAAPRASVLLGKDPEDENRRIIAVAKANLVKLEHQKSVVFEIDTHKFPSIIWQGTTDLQADDITSVKRSQAKAQDCEPKKPNRRSEAKDFIQSFLESCGGYATFKSIEKAAKDRGISRDTLYKARGEMEWVKSSPKGYGSTVYWYLEGHEPPEQLTIKA